MKFSIIAGDIHQLITIKKGQDWSQYAWRIDHDTDKYWVPIQNYNDGILGSPYYMPTRRNKMNCFFKVDAS